MPLPGLSRIHALHPGPPAPHFDDPSTTIDSGRNFREGQEFEKALPLCDEAIALGLGKVYAPKRLSIERMM
jgi:hypothetical protein